jgi:phosphatidylglycerol lysyltransferase
LFANKGRPAPFIEVTGAARDRALLLAPQAEWGLAHQGAQVMLTPDRGAGWLVRRAGPCLVALGLPLGVPALGGLERMAKIHALRPLLYKCDARTAQAARRRGWSVLRVGSEAVVDLDGWTLERPACRQLRRKLRAAQKAELRVEIAETLPLPAMEALSRDWAIRSGGERGFSMGRFDTRLLSRQRVVLAWRDADLIGFASFHANSFEWTMDLMRHKEGAPDGTMHSIVALALGRARAEGAQRLSLAAIPDCTALPAWLRGKVAGATGLGQFKRAFGPRLLRRYAAAPGRAALALGLAAVAWAIHRPPSLPDVETGFAAPGFAPSRVQHHFGFEHATVPCDARAAHLPNAAHAPRGPTHD